MQLYVADAFTDRRFCGNQAGVALLAPGEPFPDPALMTALAGELKHSETAYVSPLGERAYHIRYFTPAGEVDLCGHATVAAFTVLRAEDGLTPGPCRLVTRAGELEITVEDGGVWMDMAPPRELRTFDGAETEELYAAYGLTADMAPAGLAPALVSTGLADILLPVRDREVLAAARQDRARVMDLSRRYEAVGFHLFCPDRAYTARCRNFAPLYDIDEEAATGTSNGALTYYLYRRGRLAAGGENVFLQGEEMGKPSQIRSRLTAEGERVLVRVGGTAVITLRCTLL